MRKIFFSFTIFYPVVFGLSLSVANWDIDARKQMVDDQLRKRGIKDPRVLSAMERIERHRFVDPILARYAYSDNPLPIGYLQTISQPYIVAFMSEALRVEPHHIVLEVGTGSGYQAAILSRLGAKVFTIEIVPELGEKAKRALEQLGYSNVVVRVGDGFGGWPEEAPFDRIIVTAAPESIPPPLIDQLKPGGRLIAPVGASGQNQSLILMEKLMDGTTVQKDLIPVRFVPLTGEH